MTEAKSATTENARNAEQGSMIISCEETES
jgi:hypothetical protein